MSYTITGDDVVVHLPKAGDVAVAADDLTDPTDTLFRAMVGASHDDPQAIVDLPDALECDTSTWRRSDFIEFTISVGAYMSNATELSLPEDSGSEISSEPTAKKSNTRASRQG